MRAGSMLVLSLLTASAGAQSLRAIRLPEGTTIEGAQTTESELALVRIGVLAAGRNIRDEERPALAATMDAAYARMHESSGVLPSIFLASRTARQSAAGFDALHAEPPQTPSFGVVFLHGSG